jgi:ATP-dependent Clp protease ATP-binding subunit ClpB
MTENRVLDIAKQSEVALRLYENLIKRIVGQDEAVEVLVDIMENYLAGFCDPGHPIGNVLFLGPTGTGKTRVCEAAADALLGGESHLIKIDCAEFQHSHEIAKLVGSPPGYLGHRETHPMLTQEVIDQYNTERLKLCIMLFDEIEKSSDALWNLLLGILDKAALTLGDNRKVSFKTCLIIMTSNLGAKQLERAIEGGFGFSPNEETARSENELDKIAKDAAKRKFTPEFINRLDRIVTFKRLSRAHLKQVVDIELNRIAIRLMEICPVKFYFTTTDKAKEVLIEEGFNQKYGARHLKRTIEKRIMRPLARLVATKQINDCDGIAIEEVGKPDFEFRLQPRLLRLS